MQVVERQKLILTLIIEQYIKTGEPVGSKTICALLPFTVSSATIRNEMGALTEQGFLEQRHTSGGRVPSQKAYRYYVDHLMLPLNLSEWEVNRINTALAPNAGDPERLLADAVQYLARMTGCVAFYTKVPDPYDAIQGVDLIPAGPRRGMLVMLTTSGIVKSSLCITDGILDEQFRQSFYTITKEKLIGTPLTKVTPAMIQSLAASLGDRAFSMVSVLISLSTLCAEAAKSDIYLDGETNLLSHEELGQNVYSLISFLTAREQLKELLNERLKTGADHEIYIGKENDRYELANSTMLLSKYYDGARQGGAIGVIGSTRLNYSELIPKFDYLTSVVGRLLSERGVNYE